MAPQDGDAHAEAVTDDVVRWWRTLDLLCQPWQTSRVPYPDEAALATLRSDVPEADTLVAILLAANELKVVDEHGPWQVIVIDSGRQPAGAMPLYAPGMQVAYRLVLIEPVGRQCG